jgi:hypothetical protein
LHGKISKNVTVQIKTNNGLKVIGSATQNCHSLSLTKNGLFQLAVGATGIGKVQIVATSGKEKSVYDVEIDMTNPNPVTNTDDVILEPNSTKTISWKTFGISGSNKAKLRFRCQRSI